MNAKTELKALLNLLFIFIFPLSLFENHSHPATQQSYHPHNAVAPNIG
jgi:hypothetical protein